MNETAAVSGIGVADGAGNGAITAKTLIVRMSGVRQRIRSPRKGNPLSKIRSPSPTRYSTSTEIVFSSVETDRASSQGKRPILLMDRISESSAICIF